MLKAAALYLVLVISFIVTVILGSLIYLAFFFRNQDARFNRMDILRQQIEAGFSLVTSRSFPYVKDTVMTNVIQLGDSIHLSRYEWGLYDIAVVQVNRNQDTLWKNALLGTVVNDSMVLYIPDEDRPVSISGETVLRGTAFLPKSGIRPSYVDGEHYKGYKDIVEGQNKESGRQMQPLNPDRLVYLQSLVRKDSAITTSLPLGITTNNSFIKHTEKYILPSGQGPIKDSLLGNVQLISDTTITISSSAQLKDVLVIAPCIRIETGFRGSAQFFATDSLILEDNVTLEYPSTAAVIGKEAQRISLRIGNNCLISGTVLLYEPKRSSIPSSASLGRNCQIRGDVIVYGLIDYSKGVNISGRTTCYRFLYKSTSSLYENFLVNIKFDRSKLSPYFLTSYILLNDPKKQIDKPLKWYYHGS